MNFLNNTSTKRIVIFFSRFFSVVALLFTLAFLSSFVNEQKEYFADKTPGEISFSAENDRYSASGLFKRWKFTKSKMKERNNLETYSGEIMIDMSSVSEKSEKLTNHLKASDYFFIKDFPICKVSIDQIKKGKDDQYTANAKLDLKGIKSNVPVSFIVKRINPVVVQGHLHIDRMLHKIGIENKKTTKQVEVDFEAKLPYDL